MVDVLSKHEEAWVDVMIVEELGIVEATESPLKNAVVTFFSFLMFGFIPVAAYVASKGLGLFVSNTFLIAYEII